MELKMVHRVELLVLTYSQLNLFYSLFLGNDVIDLMVRSTNA